MTSRKLLHLTSLDGKTIRPSRRCMPFWILLMYRNAFWHNPMAPKTKIYALIDFFRNCELYIAKMSIKKHRKIFLKKIIFSFHGFYFWFLLVFRAVGVKIFFCTIVTDKCSCPNWRHIFSSFQKNTKHILTKTMMTKMT